MGQEGHKRPVPGPLSKQPLRLAAPAIQLAVTPSCLPVTGVRRGAKRQLQGPLRLVSTMCCWLLTDRQTQVA